MKYVAYLILVLVLLSVVSADMGPKPSMDVYVTRDGQPLLGTFYGAMLVCDGDSGDSVFTYTDPTCTWHPSPLAWGGECVDSKCNFHYFLPAQFRLALFFPDKPVVDLVAGTPGQLVVSNVLERNNFRSVFEADVHGNWMSVDEVTPFFKSDAAKNLLNFFIALVITLFIELSVAGIFVKVKKLSFDVWRWVVLANVLSLPLVWFVFVGIGNSLTWFVIGELFAFVFEALLLRTFTEYSYARSFLLSALMNISSLVLGGVAYIFITLFFLW